MPAENEQGAFGERAQSEFVARRRPDPAQPPAPVLMLSGLLGDSDRSGYRRLYFTRDLDYYAEFAESAVLDVEDLSAEAPPLVGLETTRVTLQRDAIVDYTHTKQARAIDEYDLDVRLAAGSESAAPAPMITTPAPQCSEDTCVTDCNTICVRNTCGSTCTCNTRCGQATCGGTCTCATACGQATCGTCATACGQATCNTCATKCGQETCAQTCNTCFTDCTTCLNTHCNTCWCQG